MSERSALEDAARIAAAARVAFVWKLGVPIALVALLLGGLIMLPVIVVLGSTSDKATSTQACSTGGATLAGATLTIAGYSGEQLTNAAAIIDAGNALGVPSYGVNVAVMTAMGESGLRVLNYGDAAGPDSRGLLQQRDSWGSESERLDPSTSARLFYERLVKVTGWQQMQPTDAAHSVQGNSDPSYYTRFWTAAQQVVSGLTGGSGGGCQNASTGTVSGNGQQLAAAIMDATAQGKITWLTPV